MKWEMKRFVHLFKDERNSCWKTTQGKIYNNQTIWRLMQHTRRVNCNCVERNCQYYNRKMQHWNENKNKHGRVGKVMYEELPKWMGFDYASQCYIYKLKSVLKNTKHLPIQVKRLDLVTPDRKKICPILLTQQTK